VDVDPRARAAARRYVSLPHGCPARRAAERQIDADAGLDPVAHVGGQRPPGHRHRAGPRHRNRDASRPPNVNWPRARLDAAGPPRLRLGWLRRHRQPVDSTRSRLRRPSRHGACEGGHKRIVMRNRVWLRCVRSYSARDPQTWRFCGERKERPSGGHNRLSGLTERGSRGWMGRYSRQGGA
jgi:hypothetical protein